MLPDNTLIKLEEGEFLAPRDKKQTNITTWEMGGVALSDGSEGYIYPWYSYTNGNSIYIQREGAERQKVLHSVEDITEMNFTFDQNMRPTIAYVANSICNLYWYDPTVAKNITTTYTGLTCPRLSLDDKRKFNVANSDIIFAYIKSFNKLCYRLQRDRYSVEYVLLTDYAATADKPLKLYRIGMNNKNRFVFETSIVTKLTDTTIVSDAYKYWRIKNITNRLSADSSLCEIILYYKSAPVTIAAIDANSAYNSNYLISNAIDGKPSTTAHAASTQGAAWVIDITLATPASIDAIAVQMRQDMNTGHGQEWQTADIEVSNDKITWRKYGKIEPRIAQMNLSLVTTTIIKI